MTTITESYVQGAPDSSGKKLRTLIATIMQPDGSIASVHMEVISLSDEDGNPISFDDKIVPLLEEILQALRDLPINIHLHS